MPTAEAAIVINRSPADVFALLDDAPRAPQWLESCISLEQRTPGPKAVGSALAYSFRQGGHPGQMDGIVTAYAPAAALGMRFSDSKFSVDVDFRLSATASGTTVQHRIGISPRSLGGRLLSPLIQLGNRRQVANNLARLKQLAEASSTP